MVPTNKRNAMEEMILYTLIIVLMTKFIGSKKQFKMLQWATTVTGNW
jgi:hypothetical protein